MNAVLVLLVGCAILIAGYVFYGSWLAKQWGVDDTKVTPAQMEAKAATTSTRVR